MWFGNTSIGHVTLTLDMLDRTGRGGRCWHGAWERFLFSTASLQQVLNRHSRSTLKMEEEEAKGIRLHKFRVRREIRQVREQYDRQMLAQKQAGSHPPNIPDGLTLYFSPADLVDGNELHVQWTMQVHKSEIPDSYWPNCQFTFDALFPEHYPVHPPKVTCKTPIFHPNISPSGSVDHSMLANGWRPSTTLFDVIEQLFLTFFVGDPNFNDPLWDCTEAADLGLSNKEEFRRRAMAVARQHKTFIPGTCPPPSRSMFL